MPSLVRFFQNHDPLKPIGTTKTGYFTILWCLLCVSAYLDKSLWLLDGKRIGAKMEQTDQLQIAAVVSMFWAKDVEENREKGIYIWEMDRK